MSRRTRPFTRKTGLQGDDKWRTRVTYRAWVAEVGLERRSVGYLAIPHILWGMTHRNQEQQRQDEETSCDELSTNRHRDLSLPIGQVLLRPL